MNVRLSILLVLVLVLIGGSVLITQVLSTKDSENKQPWMYKLAAEDISSISVSHAGKQTEYSLIGDQWVIKDGNDTPVTLNKWAGKVVLLSGPRSSRTLANKIDDPAKYGLDSPQTKVQLIDKSGYPLKFHLGAPTPDGDFWYSRLENSQRLYTVPSVWGEQVSKLATDPPYSDIPEALVNLKATDIVGVLVTYQGEQRHYLLKGDHWVFRDGEKDNRLQVDVLALPSLITTAPWASLAFEYKRDDLAPYGLDPPTTKLEIITESGPHIEVHLGKVTSDGKRQYAKPVDSQRLFTVPKDWGDEVNMLVTEPLLLTSSEPTAE